jgi:hypothetical protein
MSVGPARPRERPILPMQPVPHVLFVAKDYHADGCTTAVARLWFNGDASRCRLCPLGRCTAYAGVCLVQVRGDVDEADARMLSTVGLRWSPTGGAGGGVYFRDEHAGLVDLDRAGVVVLHVAPEALQEHLAEPLGRAAT